MLLSRSRRVSMAQVTKIEDVTVKLSQKALNVLAGKAKPFETKRDALERIILQNCSSSRQESDKESETNTEEGDE